MAEAKRGRGRPEGSGRGLTKRLPKVMTTPALSERLAQVAEQSGLSQGEIIRRALAVWLDTWESGSGGV